MSDRVRLAEPRDRESVLAMVGDYLAEVAPFGSEVVWGRRTMKGYRKLFDECVDPERAFGAVVVDREARLGFSMAVWQPMPFETTFGRTAVSLGAYVSPGARRGGLGRELRGLMHRRLAELGFETVLVGILNGNEAAMRAAESEGVRFFGVMGARALEEV